MIASIDERNFNKERMIIIPYKNKKVNSEEFVRYHEMIHHINSLRNDPQDDIDENNFELENESK